jgi:pimeloyl-ACP methyl ester carboxylesterase
MVFHFNWQGLSIAYQQKGNGTPLLLLHGFGEDSRVWQKSFETLRAGAAVVLPDLPGSGQSALHLATAASIDQMALAMQALMRHLKFEKYVVIGHSMGGYIAMAMAATHPQSLLGLGLVHSTAKADSDEKKATRQKAIAFMAENGAPAFLKTAIPGLFSPAFFQEHPTVVQELIENGNDFSVAALSAYYQAMIARPDRTQVLSQVACPVLFVAGALDKAVLLEDCLPQMHVPAVSHIKILENTAHMGMYEEPSNFEEALLFFMKSLH